MIYDIAVIGAGASGLLFSSLLKNKKISLIEANSKIGAKIKVSGGGKCNITNRYLSPSNFLGDREFVKKVLERFDNDALLDFLNRHGVKPKIDPKIIPGTYFCKSSDEINSVFAKLIKNVDLKLDTKVKRVYKKDEVFYIQTDKSEVKSQKLVIASGGMSYPILGASSIGFDIAKEFGHTINTTNPALVGFTVQKEQFWFKSLSGISLPVSIKVNTKELEGSMLFAHKGCSGPAILNASLYWKKGNITIDFLPGVKLEKFKSSRKFISTALPLPKRFIIKFLEQISLKDKSFSSLTKSEFENLKAIKSYTFAPAGNFGYTKAEATKGGVDVDEIEADTMSSKKEKNLFFIGEVLDVTGELGGYNLQWAFSSAFVCAEEIGDRE